MSTQWAKTCSKSAFTTLEQHLERCSNDVTADFEHVLPTGAVNI